MKICAKCSQEKQEDEFYKLKSGALHSYCKDCCRSISRDHRNSDVDKAREREKQSYLRNKEKKLESFKRYHRNNKAKRSEYSKAHYLKNSAAIKKYAKFWRDSNSSRKQASNAKRRCAEKEACPGWADIDVISGFYKVARGLTRGTGIVFHVDHVIPLNGEMVCGLHVQNNLRVIPAKENLTKSNKYECH